MASPITALAAPAKAHIIGIGGIGTSALAQWLQAKGWKVEGSDATASDITHWLAQHAMPVTIGAPESFVNPPNLVIYSDSVPPTHPLRVAATELKLPQHSYPEILGELSRKYHTIAVTGSHGKSTTTALIGLLLEELGLDPTVVVDTRVPEWQNTGALGNFRAGKSQFFVVEADEYRNHFHYLHPQSAVITNVDHDHVDAFPTSEDYHQAFVKFIAGLPPDATLVLSQEVQQSLAAAIGTRHVLQPPPSADVKLQVPGRHMITNFLAARTAVSPLAPMPQINIAAQKVAEKFRGTWRRFEAIGTFQGAQAFSDYAHHPTELAALITAAHDFYPQKRLVIVLQPHHHNRARAFAADFKRVLKENLASDDKIIFCEVYGVPGRENKNEAITTRDWAKEFKAPYVATLNDLTTTLTPIVTPNDILIFVGAGDIDPAARKIVT